MKATRVSTLSWRAALCAALVGVVGCGPEPKDDPIDPPVDGACKAGATCDVSAAITADTTWSADRTWRLKTHIFVKGATLTIEPGTKILGENGSSLAITTTGKIQAAGTAEKPIVFTSAMDEGVREPGDWGGVVLLGKAPLNVTGGVDSVEGYQESDDTKYGGTDAAHDCGTLRYTRIEYAGFEIAPDNELNALTVAGCGTGTTLDFIQTHKGSDDGIEFFGGTANLTHAVISQTEDDGLDWAMGWNGKVQFLIVQQSEVAGDDAFESDNNETDNNALPRSSPELWNVTLIGSNGEPGVGEEQGAMHLRRGTAGKINNTIVAYFKDVSVDVDGSASVAQAEAGELFLRTSIFFDNANLNDAFPADRAKAPAATNDGDFVEQDFFMNPDLKNSYADPLLSGALNLTTPNFMPAAGSPALVAANAGVPGAGFDTTAAFIGAIGATDWTTGWTAYPVK